MARYPTLQEYSRRGNYGDGVKKCNELLKRNPSDPRLLTIKLQLLCANGDDPDPVLEQLASLQPPLTDSNSILLIEEALHSAHMDVYPQPAAAGPAVAKLHDNAVAHLAPADKLEHHAARFAQAMRFSRLADAQQALIALKVLQPRNRVLYMAHAAVTALLSADPAGKDLQARLAVSLAKKAVADGFDADDPKLDCRVPGQVLARYGSRDDVAALSGRWRDSRQVHEASRAAVAVNGGEGKDGKIAEAKSAGESVKAEVNAAKREFEVLVEQDVDAPAVLSFAARSVRLFDSARSTMGQSKDGRVTVDAAFVAISALVRAFHISGESAHPLQAAYLAECLLKHDPHVHEARMILVYLYMRLGLGSLAVRLFQSLNVKEIQYDTVGHALFTDISLTHPHSTGIARQESFEPVKMASHALNVYTRCEEKLAETVVGVLSHGQTGMIFDVQELRDKLRMSLTRRFLLLEQRRLSRLLQDKAGEDGARTGPRAVANWLNAVDNRDFTGTGNHSYGIENVLYPLDGHASDRKWVLSSLAADSAYCLAMSFPPPVKDIDALLSELATASPDVQNPQIHDPKSSCDEKLATHRLLASDLACQVLDLQSKLKSASAKTRVDDDIESVAKAVERLGVEALVEETDPLTRTVKAHYLYLDILRTVVRTCQALTSSQQARQYSAQLGRLRDLARDKAGALHDHAFEQIKTAAFARNARALLEAHSEVGRALLGLGEARVDSFCQTVAEAARDGWEGITKIRAS